MMAICDLFHYISVQQSAELEISSQCCCVNHFHPRPVVCGFLNMRNLWLKKCYSGSRRHSSFNYRHHALCEVYPVRPVYLSLNPGRNRLILDAGNHVRQFRHFLRSDPNRHWVDFVGAGHPVPPVPHLRYANDHGQHKTQNKLRPIRPRVYVFVRGYHRHLFGRSPIGGQQTSMTECGRGRGNEDELWIWLIESNSWFVYNDYKLWWLINKDKIELMCSRFEIVAMARKLFEDYDTNCDNALNRAELKVIFDTLFTEIGKTNKIDTNRFNKLFTITDLNSDNKLNFK